MEWEVISAVSGLISAVVAVISLIQMKPFVKDEIKSEREKLKAKFFSYVLACAGWVICVLSWSWVTNQYGSFMTEREVKELIGIILSFPGVIAFVYGVKAMGIQS